MGSRTSLPQKDVLRVVTMLLPSRALDADYGCTSGVPRVRIIFRPRCSWDALTGCSGHCHGCAHTNGPIQLTQL